MKAISIVLVTLIMIGLAGFTVVNNNSNNEEYPVLVEEFVPITIKENTINTSLVDYLNRGTMRASWYGPRFHGKTTANGEIYDQTAFTAAHKSLKFGTLLRITNQRNSKSVIVRINDRGPYIPGRHLDISYAAALELGTIFSGVASVKVEEVIPNGIDNPIVLVN